MNEAISLSRSMFQVMKRKCWSLAVTYLCWFFVKVVSDVKDCQQGRRTPFPPQQQHKTLVGIKSAHYITSHKMSSIIMKAGIQM